MASIPAQAADAAGSRDAGTTCCGSPKAPLSAECRRVVTFSKQSFVDEQTQAARARLHIWKVYERKSTYFDSDTHEPLCKRVGSLGRGTQASVYGVQPVVQCANAAINKCFAAERNSLAIKSYKRACAMKQAHDYELNNAVVLRKSTFEVSNLDCAMDNLDELSYEHVHWLRNKVNGDVLACVRNGLDVRQLSLEACFRLFGASDPVLDDVKPMIKDLLVAASRSQLDAYESRYGCILPTNFLSLLLRRQKFYAKEPMCMARCQGHRNVCGIFGMFEDVSATSIRFTGLMPCYTGGELFSFIDQKWPQGMPERMAKDIFLQIVYALKHCKDHGRVIHRDIKLENVLLRKMPRAGEKVEIVLADFGLSMPAKTKHEEAGHTHPWMSTARVGTPQYWAPELWPTSISTRNNQSIDTRKTDVWALACVLHVLITGYPSFEPNPWQCERMRYFKGYRESKRFKQQFTGCNNPDETNPEIVWGHSWMFMKHWGDELKTILGRMMTLNPDNRPTLEDLLQFDWIRPLVHKSSASNCTPSSFYVQEASETESESDNNDDSEDENDNMNADYNAVRSEIFGSCSNGIRKGSSQVAHSCATTPSHYIINNNTECISVQVSPVQIQCASAGDNNDSHGESCDSVSSHP